MSSFAFANNTHLVCPSASTLQTAIDNQGGVLPGTVGDNIVAITSLNLVDSHYRIYVFEKNSPNALQKAKTDVANIQTVHTQHFTDEGTNYSACVYSNFSVTPKAHMIVALHEPVK